MVQRCEGGEWCRGVRVVSGAMLLKEVKWFERSKRRVEV